MTDPLRPARGIAKGLCLALVMLLFILCAIAWPVKTAFLCFSFVIGWGVYLATRTLLTALALFMFSDGGDDE